MSQKYDFSGYVTKNDIRCSDGRTIRRDAFKDNDGDVVPLVWSHIHNDPSNIIGHVMLENRSDGVYGYATFNRTQKANEAREAVCHGDINSMSIYANGLTQSRQGDVMHGIIREVSLVVAGANPGATIDFVLEHSDDSDEEGAMIYMNEPFELYHADGGKPEETKKSDDTKQKGIDGDKTVGEVLDSLTEEQTVAVAAYIRTILDAIDEEDEEEESDKGKEGTMKHNAFEDMSYVGVDSSDELRHQQEMRDHADIIFADAKRLGSLRDSVLAHAEQTYDVKDVDALMHESLPTAGKDYGIKDIGDLYPDAKSITPTPAWIRRDMGWVSVVMNGVHKVPFSRVKSLAADITAEEARAKGYLTGHKKKDEVFTLLKRSTSPTTIYKKQKIDRDDLIDITDFAVVPWLKSEMKMMLDEEKARAILIGDGRLSSNDDKISEECVRPIWTDDELYTIKVKIDITDETTESEKASSFIDSIIYNRKLYKGSGNPTLFITEDMLSSILLLKDDLGHYMYESVEKIAQLLRVSNIVPVPVMENQKRSKNAKVESEQNGDYILAGIMVNLADYGVGADTMGRESFFDDFDIDYNQMKYLIEGRMSGALTTPKSAMAIEFFKASEAA